MLTKLGSSLLVLLGLSVAVFSRAQTPRSEDLEAHFEKLQSLRLKILKSGSNPSDMRDMRNLRNFFASQGDIGARFLLEKLGKANSEEMAFMKSNAWDESKMDIAAQWIAERKGPPKYDLCLILADMFDKVSPDVQEAILAALQHSYTPSTFFTEDIQFLNLALSRVGPPAVPVWLALANHQTEFVRCNISGLLTSLGTQLSGSAGGKVPIPDAPVIPCTGSVEQRRKALSSWQQWWETQGRLRRFPKTESLYDWAGGTP
jgi:hypothetical protein